LAAPPNAFLIREYALDDLATGIDRGLERVVHVVKLSARSLVKSPISSIREDTVSMNGRLETISTL
jgi:hypothetical protein